ncbi:MAG: SelB C-terminal domain-containing protein, partial [Planctomycetes bacterium]|nr:SelB C-terminal domain-containing protein [Planctomycetota bacterium]
ISPGDAGFAQLRLAEPVVAVYGQRFIVRDETASRTIGGGTVLRCSPRRRRIRGASGADALAALYEGDAPQRVEEVLRFAGFDRPGDLTVAAEAGVPVSEVPDIRRRLAEAERLVTLGTGSGVEVTRSALDALADRATRWLAQFHVTHPDEPGMRPDVLVGYLDRKSRPGLGRLLYDRLLAMGRVKAQGRYVCHPDHAPSLSAQDERIWAALLEEFETAGLSPPALADLVVTKQTNLARIERLVKIAAATEQLVEVRHGMFLHAACEERLRQQVADVIRGGGDTSVSAIRQALGSTRKYVVPFMEYLDRLGFTRREGDGRVLCESDKP